MFFDNDIIRKIREYFVSFGEEQNRLDLISRDWSLAKLGRIKYPFTLFAKESLFWTLKKERREIMRNLVDGDLRLINLEFDWRNNMSMNHALWSFIDCLEKTNSNFFK